VRYDAAGQRADAPQARPLATEVALEPHQPNVPSARSRPETALSGRRSSFVSGRRAQLFARRFTR